MSLEQLASILEETLALGASQSIEKFFGKEEFCVWRAAVRETSIEDCGEKLIEIPERDFPRFHPHSYVEAGAPYLAASPFMLREGVVERLFSALKLLRREREGWGLKIFDGYRPLRVQRFLVQHFYRRLVDERGLQEKDLSEAERASLLQEVFQIVAEPNDDPRHPTPHSTGGAVDLTLVDETGSEVMMGSPIDAMPPECLPAHFADKGGEGILFHQHRVLLANIMQHAGFYRLPQEWWHFSFGDPAWSVLHSLTLKKRVAACYGRID